MASPPPPPPDPSNAPPNRSIYEAAQLRSSMRTGNSLHRGNPGRFTGNGGGSFRSSLRSSSTSGGRPSSTSTSTSFSASPAVAELDVSRSHDGGRFASRGSTSHGSGGASFPLRSSLRPPTRPRGTGTAISPSGNKLLTIRISPEERVMFEDDVELDRAEIRMLARGGTLGDPVVVDAVPPPGEDFDFEWDDVDGDLDESDGRSSSSKRMVSYPGEGRLRAVPIRPGGDGDGDDDDDDLHERKERLKAAYRASSFRRGIFASVLVFLTAACVFFTVENFIRVRTAEDWAEPRYAVGNYGAVAEEAAAVATAADVPDGSAVGRNQNSNSNSNSNSNQTPSYNVAQPQTPAAASPFLYDPDGRKGGIDWITGPDAPLPFLDARSRLPSSVSTHLADWPSGTRRIRRSSPDFPDGFGSIRVDPRVLFRELPFYWGDSFGGGDAVAYALGGCLGLVLAADGGRDGLMRGGGFDPAGDDGGGDGGVVGTSEEKQKELSIGSVFGRTYVNVDLSTVEGIKTAGDLELASSGMADVLFSPYFTEVVERVLDAQHKGRMFVMMIHPCEREFKRFRQLRKVELMNHGNGLIRTESTEECNGDVLSMSYTAYSKSHLVEDNWMTRTLLDKPVESHPELTADDMHAAKEILRSKAIVGMYDDILGAIRHYSRYFGWDGVGSGGTIGENTVKCFENSILEAMKREDEEHDLMTSVIASGSGLNAESLETPFIVAQEEETMEGSMAWENVLERNKFDLELYLYGHKLYSYQTGLS